MEIVLAVLKAISSIPSIMGWIDELVARHVASLEEKRRENISESAALLGKAKTQEEKRAALLARFGAGRK